MWFLNFDISDVLCCVFTVFCTFIYFSDYILFKIQTRPRKHTCGLHSGHCCSFRNHCVRLTNPYSSALLMCVFDFVLFSLAIFPKPPDTPTAKVQRTLSTQIHPLHAKSARLAWIKIQGHTRRPALFCPSDLRGAHNGRIHERVRQRRPGPASYF